MKERRLKQSRELVGEEFHYTSPDHSKAMLMLHGIIGGPLQVRGLVSVSMLTAYVTAKNTSEQTIDPMKIFEPFLLISTRPFSHRFLGFGFQYYKQDTLNPPSKAQNSPCKSTEFHLIQPLYDRQSPKYLQKTINYCRF